MLPVTTKSKPDLRSSGWCLTRADAVLWFSLREIVHDAIFVDLVNTRPSRTSRGLRGPGI